MADDIAERLREFISDPSDCEPDPFPPPCMFSPEMSVTSLSHIDEDYSWKNIGTGCDVWELYMNDLFHKGLHYITLRWTNDRVQFQFHKELPENNNYKLFGPDMCSFKRSNICCLTEMQESFSYLLDMKEYASQTRSTPFLLPSYQKSEMKVFLVNHDSYVRNRKNVFGFRMPVRTLLEKLETVDGCVSVHNVVGRKNDHTQRNTYGISIMC